MSDVPFGRGTVGQLEYRDGVLVVFGWLTPLNQVLDGFRILVNDKEYGAAQQIEVPNVAEVYPFVPGARTAGFYLRQPVPARAMSGRSQIEVYGMAGGRPVVRLSTMFHADFAEKLPVPPPELMRRVAGNSHVETFQCTGLQACGQFLDAVNHHRDGSPVHRLLDWGCGVGRVTAFILSYAGVPEVHGCDIDAESVAWCRERLTSGTFAVIEPYPPTPYVDQMFDVIIGYSVLTHLPEDVQHQWLQELRRILRPGGLALLSIHGPFAAHFNGDEIALKAIQQHGIYDAVLDPALDGIAPRAYYRSVYHDPRYVQREWGRYMEVLQYASGGMGNYQDLVVLRRPH